MGTTANYHWTLPTVHSDASSWGGELNTTIGAIDSVVWNNEQAFQLQVQPNALTVSSKPSTGTPASLWFMNGEVTAGQQYRWLIYETAEPETGGNAGSNLVIQNYTDAGVAMGSVLEFVRATGDASFAYNVGVQGQFTVTSTVTANSGVVVSRASSGNAQFFMEDNTGAQRGACYWDRSTNSISLINLATSNSYQLDPVGNCIANPTGGNNFVVISGNGLKPGGGSWGAYSDARIKTVRGDYTSGLEAVLQLRPVTYVYKGDYAKDAGGKEFVGLVADEAMTVLPEMVSLQKGTIDGREVSDLKVLDTTALLFALVNCVKELKAEIEELKAK